MEQRQGKRKSLRGQGEFVSPGAVTMTVRMLDVSVNGAGFVGGVNLTRGLRGNLRFSVPDSNGYLLRLDAQAVVADCVLSGADQGFRSGVRFEPELPSAARSAVEDFLAR